MKTNAMIRVILFSLVILILLTILAVGIAADRLIFRDDFASQATTSSHGSVDANTVHKISIDWTSGTVTLCPADVDEIVLTETASEGAGPMSWVTSGDTLEIVYNQQNNFIHVGFEPDKDLLIEVPRNWSCDVLEVDTASADIKIENLTVGKADLDGASGKFDFQNCTVDTLEIDSASGGLTFSGRLNALDHDAASGDCQIELLNCPDRIEIDSASGDLDLTLPEDCGFTVEVDALSGDLDTDFEVSRRDDAIVTGNGSCRIDVSTMSGDVYIHKGTGADNCDH